MEKRTPPWTLAEIAEIVGGVASHHPQFRVERLGAADTDDPAAICFAQDERYLAVARASRIGAVLIPESAPELDKPHIRHRNPRQAFGLLLMIVDRPLPLNDHIHPTAAIHPKAFVHADAQIGAFAVVEAGANVGAKARVYAHAYVGENCVLEEGSQVHPHAVLVRDVVLERNAIVGPGAVLGHDGFGYFFDGQQQRKIPQVGKVKLGPDVEIGALTTIDRATAGVTQLGAHTKIDNLVQIGHNVKIGENTVIASFSGVAGSSEIGDRVTIAGQCGVGDHAYVGNDIQLGGRAGVSTRLEDPGMYVGYPPLPSRQGLLVLKYQRELPELANRIKALEKRLAELEKSTS